MEGVFNLFSPPLQLDSQGFKLRGAVLQPLVLGGRLRAESPILSLRYKTCSRDITSITHHFKAGGQFEQQPAVFWKMLSREVEEGHQEVNHGDVVLAALRQPLKQLGTLPKEIAGKTFTAPINPKLWVSKFRKILNSQRRFGENLEASHRM